MLLYEIFPLAYFFLTVATFTPSSSIKKFFTDIKIYSRKKKENSLVNCTFISVKKGSLFAHISPNRIQFVAITIDARDKNSIHSYEPQIRG